MEKFDPIDIDFIINSEEVKADTNKIKDDLKSVGQTAEETSKKVNEQIKGAFANPDNEKAISDVNERLKEQGTIVGANNQKIFDYNKALKDITEDFSKSSLEGLDTLKNKIPQLLSEIDRLKEKNDGLTKSGEATIPVWQQVAKGLFSWGTALSVGATLLAVYGKEIAQWVVNLLKGGDAINVAKERIKSLNAALESNSFTKALQNVFQLRSQFELFNEGLLDKDIVLKKYNETLGQVAGTTDDINEAEATFQEKSDAYVKVMLYRAAATAATAEAAKQLNDATTELFRLQDREETLTQRAQDPVQTSTRTGAQFGKAFSAKKELETVEEKIKKTQADAEKIKTSFNDIIKKFEKDALNLATLNGFNLFGDDGGKKQLSEYQNLLDKLAELDKEYSRKSFTKDEEELQALRDKFDKIRTLVQRYNADPDNKAQIIDLSGLDDLQKQAEETLTYRQSTENLKDELAVQKQLFEDFENYKKTFGIDKAKEEFAGKIDAATSYYEYLKQQKLENEEAFTAVDNGTATGAQIERVNFINEALKKETDEQKKLFDKQLAQLLNYQQQRNLLIEQYNAQRLQLIAAGENDAVAELDKQHQEELDALDDANVKKLQSYKTLFDGIVGLTAKEARIVIANAKELLKTQNISAELKTKILKQIAEVEKILNASKLTNVQQYTNAIGSLGASLSQLGNDLNNSSLSNAGNILTNLAGGVQNLFGAFAEGVSTGDAISLGLSGITSLLGLIGKIGSKQAERREKARQYYLSVIAMQNQYNLSLQEQLRLQSVLDENVFITNYEGRIRDALAAILEANAAYDAAINNLIENGNITQSNSQFVQQFLGTSALDYPDLLQQSEDGIYSLNTALAQSLLDNGLINDETAAILENIIAWEEALEAAQEQIKEVISDLTGSLGTDLKNVLVDAFQSGENAAIRMGETVENVLENVLSSFVFNAIFQEAFDNLEAQMAASFGVGGDGSWIDDFAAFFNSASGLTDDFNAALAEAQAQAAAAGFNIFDGSSSAQQGLTGAIRREITEETGSELVGLFRGQFDITKRMAELTEAYYEREQAHHANLLELIAINTLIEQNTLHTVEKLSAALVHLESISENTEQHYLLDLGG